MNRRFHIWGAIKTFFLFFVQLLMFDFLFSSSRHIENYVPATSKKRHNAHPNITGKNREHLLFIDIMNMVHHSIIRPCLLQRLWV